MERALGATKPSEAPSVKSPAKSQKKDIISPPGPENNKSSAPQSPQRKLSVTAQPGTTEPAKKPDAQKQPSPVPSQKKPPEPQKTSGPTKTPDLTKQTEQKQNNATEATQQESGGFFGFGGGKSQPDAAKPAESVTGKMFGFGSSIFSSASTLITTAVQDQPKTTPPVSPKMSPAKEVKSPATQKKDQQKKPEEPEKTKTPPLVQAKVDKAPSETTKATAASLATVRSGQSSCPLCKVELNIGSQDLPNYNTCTKCKNTVCNQCGFNPMPNVSEVSETH